ncbi:NADH dehydrogenase (ubiquinone) 30 kDa subunit [Methanolacinia petrolearia DSM 11571]|uniref:NADH dehydrogenase (Ubiquinone) 30 kDa subunit n=1 Tax=Methanolacinia petrolearia (strain DSM 11571 / OCM 486 / SEBR 4847) TaxID=679926 RepID=E1RKF8_METP4|nr:NADH-quinone oxidoreductase subunit C [Methanolacinia petrolearia]ADN35811.1 NADH dehydrogenase (ubiquinone) 30 kDa subunit [Methanolacinia petrolearia DSM 11571]
MADSCKPTMIANNGVMEHEFHLAEIDTDFGERIEYLKRSGYVLLCLFCREDSATRDLFRLTYIFESQENRRIYEMEYETSGDAISIAEKFPTASLYEREITDGFGILFRGSFDTRRLILHAAYPKDFHPLKKSFCNGPVNVREIVPEEELYKFRRLDGKGVYEVAVGPVHAGIIEPGHFRFSVIGEAIFNLETRLYYLHRGIEKLAEGKKPAECLKIAESISGDESVANAVCFCLAAEKIAGIRPSLRAETLRGIALEMERICSLLSDCAGMLTDVAYPVGASRFMALKEECMRMNRKLFGHRFIRDYITIGGVSGDVGSTDLLLLESFADRIGESVKEAYDSAINSSSVIDRLATTGIIRQSLIRPLNLTGPAARSSGSRRDVRTDYPYGIYNHHTPVVPSHDAGDVLSRFMQKAEEIQASARFIKGITGEMPAGEIKTSGPDIYDDGCAFAMVEGARGQNLHYLEIRDGKIWRYKVRTASFTNWLSIEHAVIGNIVPDFPVINKSLNLSYAGNDL